MNRRTISTALLLMGAMAACGQESSTPGELLGPGEAASAKAPAPTKKPYTLTFSGDIESGPIPNVMLDPKLLLYSVAHANVTLHLPALPELAGCGPTGRSWEEYAGDWTGSLLISQSRGVTTMQLKTRWVNNSSFWLSVQDDAVQTEAGGAVTLTFTDAKSAANVFGKRTIYPCVTFTITAVPQ